LEKLRKIGLFGGTFDPPHTAHITLAENISQKICLDCIYFIPTSIHAFKLNYKVTPVEIRYEMLQAALANKIIFRISRIEIDRPSVSYTVDTLREFKAYEKLEDAELYYLMGMDNLRDLHLWRNSAEIFKFAKLVILKRPGYNDSKIINRYHDKVIFVETPLMDISSTYIRGQIQKGYSVDNLIPKSVSKILKKYNLYTEYTTPSNL
jgi:nicotinate-nucleotide adenylyltransferase